MSAPATDNTKRIEACCKNKIGKDARIAMVGAAPCMSYPSEREKLRSLSPHLGSSAVLASFH